jgi:hypothetical protein
MAISVPTPNPAPPGVPHQPEIHDPGKKPADLPPGVPHQPEIHEPGKKPARGHPPDALRS